MRGGNIFTVPAGAPFLPAIARTILSGAIGSADGKKPDALTLPDITIFLPTRRAARALQEAFLEASGSRALIMPSIRPIAEGDEDLTLLASLAGLGAKGAAGLDRPPAVPPLTRTLILMQLVDYWQAALAKQDEDDGKSRKATPAQSANLAAELAKLIDDVERENISLAGIAELVPDAFAQHWTETVDFLKIVTDYWPKRLDADGLMSAAARTNSLILNEAQRIGALPADKPVIVAGVTGSIPATVELMRAVATRANGAIVLPALDTALDDESFEMIAVHPEHPQFGFAKLLTALGVARSDVRVLPGVEIDQRLSARAAFVSEAMRPAKTTALWHSYVGGAKPDEVRTALAGVARINAPSSQDEAEAIALILREAVDTPGRTAALVSPDRVLARRVAIRLEAFGIRVDDSAGRPFAKTVPGTFLNLVVAAVRSEFAPAETMALLKHPLTRLGLSAFDVRRHGRSLELLAFRRPYMGRGLDGIATAINRDDEEGDGKERPTAAAQRLWSEDRQGALNLVERLSSAFSAMTSLDASSAKAPLQAYAKAHIAAAEAIAALPSEDQDDGSNPIWRGAAGNSATAFFTELIGPDTPGIDIRSFDYAELYAALVARLNVREHSAVHPRISIWGPMEARLQQPDVVILGSLNEGTWPQAAEPGAWLNRPMREQMGLPAPEEEIGRAALDFTSLLGAERVYLTRAEKTGGVPTVPSRWLMRIDALLNGLSLADCLVPSQPWLAWARARDFIDPTHRLLIKAPEPRPSVSQRPRSLSVTRIETWTANPYAIYASKVLRLEPLPVLGASPDQSLRGSLVHQVLAKFAKDHPSALPKDISGALKRIAREVLYTYTGNARVAAFWMPRLERFLDWFAASEIDRRLGVVKVFSEISGALTIDAPAGPFKVTARADRIDDDGAQLTITDYKTGSVPADTSVKSGRSPQLPLEAAIALGESGFASLTPRGVAALRYIRASGGEPPGKETTVADSGVETLAEETLNGLSALVAEFDNPNTPYKAVRRPRYKYDYDDYAHLARVAEWSAHASDDSGD